MHCIICNVCIVEFDHHCFWVNNCIGANNLTRFVVFLFSVAFNLLMNLIICIHSKLILILLGLFCKNSIESKTFPKVYVVAENIPDIVVLVSKIVILVVVALFFFPVW